MGYSYQSYNKETMARAIGKSLSVSTKHCIEITARIRRRKLAQVKRLLQDIIDMKKPLEFRRFNGDVGHRRGKMGPGRYPVKAAKEVLKVIDVCEANAQYKGLNTGNMVLVHSNAHLGSRQWHYGRKRRRLMKRTHIEIVLEERGKPKKTEAKKIEPKETVKPEQETKEKKPEPKKSEQTTAKKPEQKVKQSEPKKETEEKQELVVKTEDGVKK